MLEKKVPFCIDHFSIATTHRDRPIDLVTKLGFTTADCYTCLLYTSCRRR